MISTWKKDGHAISQSRVARFFWAQKNGKNVPKLPQNTKWPFNIGTKMPQIYQMAMKYTKIAIKILNGRTI
jgi:hypothetical protein